MSEISGEYDDWESEKTVKKTLVMHFIQLKETNIGEFSMH